MAFEMIDIETDIRMRSLALRVLVGAPVLLVTPMESKGRRGAEATKAKRQKAKKKCLKKK